MRTMTPGFRAVLSSDHARNRAPRPAPQPTPNPDQLTGAYRELNLAEAMWSEAASSADRAFWAAAVCRARHRLNRVRGG